ncbi:hypothetical protein PVAR5_2631 [Paecilomyces variotii No. 5]|uniref:ABC bile acid transporter n=1 Tax=Byssochlamys spectabilis (strain No. 5 / NBRC 109023) TaxID=1356009 RepID=V5FW94_BYSSN|nr:hypothetical protein PVAR5_2631 [Paecilomyces variotii No. 5]
MAVSKETGALIAGALGLSIVAVCTTPALISIAARFSPKARRGVSEAVEILYEDQDGAATPESVKAFTDRLQRASIAALTVIGFFTSLAIALLTTKRGPESYLIEAWLQVGIWGFHAIHAVALFVEPSPKKRFALGGHAFISSIVTIAVPCIEAVLLWSHGPHELRNKEFIALFCTHIAVALIRALLTATLPRRPDVFRDGKIVDRERTTSLIGKYAFFWVDPLLTFAIKNRGLSISDLHELNSQIRSRNLREKLEKAKGSHRLWKALIVANAGGISQQFALAMVISVLSFAPQIALLGILRSLEARGTDSWNPYVSWFWVFALGVLMVITTGFEQWQFWIIQSRVGLPIAEGLAAITFAKSMRRKDVKHTKKSRETKQADSENPEPESDRAGAGEQKDDDDSDEQKSRQSTVNLVAVDSKRIWDFTTYWYLIPQATLKLLVACAFLSRLIGWRSLLSGLAVAVVVTPVNIIASKKYTSTQTELMKNRDQKMAVVSEVLMGIRQIKFSALEAQWHAKVSAIRNIELGAQWSAFLWDVVLLSIWILGPIMLSAVSLAVYAWIHGGLTASVAFTAMALFGALELSLAVLPEMIANGLEAWVSLVRIEKYLDSPEKKTNTVPGDHVAFDEAAVAWPTDEEVDPEDRFVLRNVNLSFPPKGFSVIAGKTGSGKSLLLASILGECDILEGIVRVPVPPALEDRFDDSATPANWIIDSAIAYVAQIPWIENASIKDNILFGLPYDAQRYRKVLFACALEKDLDMLPDGDLTDIGANGINLSGGQRWRISFARALYSRAGILVMDDLFSALDAHTGRHLYEHAVTGELGTGRTRILVTHHVGLCLPRTDYLVVIEDGTIKQAGNASDLKESDDFAEILSQEREEETIDQVAEENGDILDMEETTLQKVISNRSQRRESTAANGDNDLGRPTPRKFVEDEKRETGSIKLAVYKAYFKTAGPIPFWIFVVLLYVSYVVFIIGRSWWVNVWTSSSSTKSRQQSYLSVAQSQPEQHILMAHQTAKAATLAGTDDDLLLYLGVYIGLSVMICIVGSLRYYFILRAGIRASRNLFQDLAYAVLRAPLRWLDTVPVGRILNRFTADFHMIDSRLGYDIGLTAYRMLDVLGVIVAGVLVSPLVMLFAALLLGVCLRFALRYLAGAREVKRLESNAKSPIYEQFGSALVGLGTIRAFGKTSTYLERMYGKIDAHCRAWWYLWLFNRWLSWRMNIVGALFATITAALVVSLPSINASLAGFALSFALQYTVSISMALRMYSNLELDMNAVERVTEYSNIAIEDQGGDDAPAAWPTEGRVEVEDLVVGYAPDLPPVLKGLTFTVETNQRVGVVGRTGAGKSSLTLALFRFLEAREGHIYIDGVDVSKIKLHDLRSRLAIIPQDPVLFSGTIRTNLDPFDQYGDGELYDALERVHLISRNEDGTIISSTNTPGTITPVGTAPSSVTGKNANIFASLSSPISEGGLNLSQGQRQLLCLARAIVSRPKVMVLDEATSAVDMSTDALIQQSIRSEFGRNSTSLLVIAHRLSTIVDFDRILVMDAGKAVEFGSPRELMEIEGGVFRSLVEDSGERRVLEDIIFGEQRGEQGDEEDAE